LKFSSVLGIHVGVAQKGTVITRFENTMRVSRLEIFGFKSFMERLVLPIKDGVTGVVGPNGCGKSNIVDALRELESPTPR
jgi:ABC-type cobalamin/Fe3+-siderophores transport system ATPase subunit